MNCYIKSTALLWTEDLAALLMHIALLYFRFILRGFQYFTFYSVQWLNDRKVKSKGQEPVVAEIKVLSRKTQRTIMSLGYDAVQFSRWVWTIGRNLLDKKGSRLLRNVDPYLPCCMVDAPDDIICNVSSDTVCQTKFLSRKIYPRYHSKICSFHRILPILINFITSKWHCNNEFLQSVHTEFIIQEEDRLHVSAKTN